MDGSRGAAQEWRENWTLVLAAPAALAAQTLTRQSALPADGEIEVSNVAGRVDVTGWDKAEVQLEAVLEGRYEHDGAHIIVSRGLGVSGIPLRFACAPEALLVTLRTQGRGDTPLSSDKLPGYRLSEE